MEGTAVAGAPSIFFVTLNPFKADPLSEFQRIVLLAAAGFLLGGYWFLRGCFFLCSGFCHDWSPILIEKVFKGYAPLDYYCCRRGLKFCQGECRRKVISSHKF